MLDMRNPATVGLRQGRGQGGPRWQAEASVSNLLGSLAPDQPVLPALSRGDGGCGWPVRNQRWRVVTLRGGFQGVSAPKRQPSEHTAANQVQRLAEEQGKIVREKIAQFICGESQTE